MARPTAASQDSTSLHVPLAERLRPRSLGEVVGQQHLLGEGMPLRIAFESGQQVQQGQLLVQKIALRANL